MTEIRSYRRVFDLERRVYSVDRLRLNPGGVPVRGIVYFVVLLLGALVVGAMPGVGSMAQTVPWYLRDIAFPAGAATVLTVVRVEGRTFHLAARALVRHLASPRRVDCLRGRSEVGRRWYPDDMLVLPDGSDSSLRRMRYRGPGAVLVAVEHQRAAPTLGDLAGLGCVSRRRALVLSQTPGGRSLRRGTVISLQPDTRLLVSARRGTREGTTGG